VTRYASLSDMWLMHVKEYKSKAWQPFHVQFPWDRAHAEFITGISERRAQKRLDSYLIPGEFERAKESIRFGHEKKGRGYQKERGDFCLIAGHLKKGHLTVFYRSLELIGGLHFDLPVWAAVEDNMGPINRVSIFAVRAFVFGVKGKVSHTKEHLYEQVKAYHEENE
jgi:hypothetical protein